MVKSPLSSLLRGVPTWHLLAVAGICFVVAFVLHRLEPPLASMERAAEDSMRAGGDGGVSPTTEGNERAETVAENLHGRTTVHAPPTLPQGAKRVVVARVATANYPGEIPGSPLTTDSTLAAETSVQAKLQGDDLIILPLSSEKQELLDDRPTEWRWQIAARHSGQKELFLTISVVVRSPDGLRDLPIERLPVSVTLDPIFAANQWVRTDAKSFLAGAGAIFTVLTGLRKGLLKLVERIRGRQDDPDSSAKERGVRRAGRRRGRNR